MRRLLIATLLVFACAAPQARAVGIVVVLEGVEGEVLENVRNNLGIEQYKDDPGLNRNWAWRLHGKADKEIRAALKPYGYYRPVVKKNLQRIEGGWKAVYRIEAGEPVPLAAVDVRVMGDAQDDPEFRRLLKQWPLIEGAPLDHLRYERLKSSLQKLALERGYFDARFVQHEIRLDLQAYAAEISLHFDSGPRYRFGEVRFQSGPLSDEFLAGYLNFKKGDAFSVSALLGLQEALSGSDYFSSVEVSPRRDLADGLQVPVEVNLVPRKRNKYSFGAGFGTDTGARLSAGYERRRVNRRGHRINTDLRLSQIRNSLSAEYHIPLKNPRTEQLAFSAGYFDATTDNSTSRTSLLGVTRSARRWGLSETLGFKFKREDFSVGDEEDVALLLMPEASWLWVRSDDRTYTTRGARLQLFLRGASETLLSDASFLQARLQAKFIRKVFGDSRILLRGDAGISWVGDFDELPASVRFFAGGDQSVRGYEFESLGPKDSKGDVIGGRHLLVGSAEYEQHITGKWSAALFVDTGNAIDDLSDSLSSGAGLGVRWRSPVGLIRVDLAAALSESGNPVRLHLVIGPDL